MNIDDVVKFIATANADDLSTILDAIGARLEQIETPSFEARSIRQAIRSSRTRAAKVNGKGPDACLIRQGMKQGRGR